MTSSAKLVRNLVRPLLVLGALGACGAEERADLRARLAAAQRDSASMSTELKSLREADVVSRTKLLEYRTKSEAADASTGRLESAAKEASDRADAAKDALEAKKKENDRLASHRDELKEWIEKELLPIAEEHDKRLVNLREAAQDMASEVERIRGLPFKRPFMRRLITRTQVGEWMRRDMKKDMPEDEVRRQTQVGVEFGLMRPDTNLYEIVSEFLEAGALAFYRPDTGTFYHIEGNDGRGARPVVCHELVHALEDQYFGLDEFARAVEHDADAGLARKGLVEGSAVHFAAKYEAAHPDDKAAMMKAESTPEMMQKQMKMVPKVPPVLVASMGLYPYKNAADWVDKIGADTPEQMDALYKDPPVSTEQVLHPAKFPLVGPRDYPHRLGVADVAPILGDGFEHVDDDDMGELVTGIMLAQIGAPNYVFAYPSMINLQTQAISFQGAVKKAVEGWDGDRYTAWADKSTGAVTIVWTSVWDSEQDAQEFYEAYADLLGKHVTGKTVKPRPAPVRFTDAKTSRVSGLDVSGARVVAVLGAPAAKAEALFAAGAAVKVTADPRDPNDK